MLDSQVREVTEDYTEIIREMFFTFPLILFVSQVNIILKKSAHARNKRYI